MGESGDWFDWWVVGGRWTGILDGYDPTSDPANLEVCYLCNGTGVRPDMVVEGGCNKCGGGGKSTVHPSRYTWHAGDVIPVENLTDKHYEEFYRVLCEYGRFDSEDYRPWADDVKFVKKEMPPLAWLKEVHAGQMAVVVDTHN